jgi:hypothetical protein
MRADGTPFGAPKPLAEGRSHGMCAECFRNGEQLRRLGAADGNCPPLPPVEGGNDQVEDRGQRHQEAENSQGQ